VIAVPELDNLRPELADLDIPEQLPRRSSCSTTMTAAGWRSFDGIGRVTSSRGRTFTIAVVLNVRVNSYAHNQRSGGDDRG